MFFRSTPPTAASSSSTVAREPFMIALKSLVLNVQFLILMSAFGIATGSFYALSTLFAQILDQLYDPSQIGLAGFLMVVSGIGGAFLAGFIADRLKRMRVMLIVFYCSCFLGVLLFQLTLQMAKFSILITVSFIMGFVLTAILPLTMEATVNCTFPVDEVVSVGIVVMAAQVFGIISIMGMQAIQSAAKSWLIPMWTLVGFIGLSLVLVLTFKAQDRRKEADQKVITTNQ
jgi:nitrate/nitrite transporter NarK